jgi:hypothetical protein
MDKRDTSYLDHEEPWATRGIRAGVTMGVVDPISAPARIVYGVTLFRLKDSQRVAAWPVGMRLGGLR